MINLSIEIPKGFQFTVILGVIRLLYSLNTSNVTWCSNRADFRVFDQLGKGKLSLLEPVTHVDTV